jgi:hypothetical protein
MWVEAVFAPTHRALLSKQSHVAKDVRPHMESQNLHMNQQPLS